MSLYGKMFGNVRDGGNIFTEFWSLRISRFRDLSVYGGKH